MPDALFNHHPTLQPDEAPAAEEPADAEAPAAEVPADAEAPANGEAQPATAAEAAPADAPAADGPAAAEQPAAAGDAPAEQAATPAEPATFRVVVAGLPADAKDEDVRALFDKVRGGACRVCYACRLLQPAAGHVLPRGCRQERLPRLASSACGQTEAGGAASAHMVRVRIAARLLR